VVLPQYAGLPLVFPSDYEIAVPGHASTCRGGLRVPSDRDERVNVVFLETLDFALKNDIQAG